MSSKPTHTDAAWDDWGKKNPYFGVLGHETGDIDSDPVAREKFFATGEAHVAEVLDHLTRHYGPLPASARVVDFGCGVGRLLAAFSRRFERSVGIDIAPSMLAIAKRNLQDRSGVDYVARPEDVPGGPGSVDLVHSYIVLQHIRPDQGMPIIRALLDLLKPGGLFALHMTIGDLNPRRALLNKLRYRIPPLHWLYNLSKGRPWNEPITEMNRYDAAALFDLFRTLADGPVLVRPYDQNRHVGVMILGRIAAR